MKAHPTAMPPSLVEASFDRSRCPSDLFTMTESAFLKVRNKLNCKCIIRKHAKNTVYMFFMMNIKKKYCIIEFKIYTYPMITP